jgi:hypothetical protein
MLIIESMMGKKVVEKMAPTHIPKLQSGWKCFEETVSLKCTPNKLNTADIGTHKWN